METTDEKQELTKKMIITWSIWGAMFVSLFISAISMLYFRPKIGELESILYGSDREDEDER